LNSICEQSLILHESLPNTLEGRLINFKKCRQVAAMLKDFQVYRQASYNFEPQREIQLFLVGEGIVEPELRQSLKGKEKG
jgi:hypothetical protein